MPRLSLHAGAEYSGVSVRTLRRLIARGALPAYRMAGTRVVRVTVEDLDALFQRVPNARMFDNLTETGNRP